MEPAAYRSMTSVMKKVRPLPPQAPIPDGPQEHIEEEVGQSNPPDTNWTVYSTNITRGNIAMDLEPEDPRINERWSAAPQVQSRGYDPMRWMSTAAVGDPPMSEAWAGTSAFAPFKWKDDEATPRPTDSSESAYPHPNVSLPHPSLCLDFRMSVMLDLRISVGATPFGHRNWISFTGGSWSGSWGSGIVLPGGQDSQIIIPNGSARLETNYLLQTHDNPPAHIVIKTHGWRTGPLEVLARLADPELADNVDPNSYKFRIFIEMETGDERYSEKVNCGMWVGSGMRKGAEVIYDAYRLS